MCAVIVASSAVENARPVGLEIAVLFAGRDDEQVYYTDEQTGLGRWNNPFEGESLSERLDRIDRRQREENEIAEQEKLAGFELAPVIDVFKSEQALATKDRIGAWMTRNELEVSS